MKNNIHVSLSVFLLGLFAVGSQAADRTLARIIWQNSDDQTVYWGDLKQGEQWSLAATPVEGYPKLDVDHQSHVQMQIIDSIVLAGIHDDENGELQSGWVALDAGVTREAHGDHFHLHYGTQPRVLAQRLDQYQGNPAHVYRYDRAFYLANDKKDGFTRVAVDSLIANPSSPGDKFYSAGGGHITLAVVSDSVAYSTWIDRDGENMGRVDVIGLHGDRPGYALQLPSGGLHGATTNAGKVFFAPSDGICWVAADPGLNASPASVDIHHLSLGTDAQGQPKRTGAFHNVGSHIVFTTGRGENTELCLVNAAAAKPSVIKVALSGQAETSFTTPIGLVSRSGEPFVASFEENAGSDEGDKMHIFAVDPNRDGDYRDAKSVATVSIGRNCIEGHSGHHEATPIGKRYVLISNPGDGTFTLVDTNTWQVQATLTVGGAPTRLVAIAE